MLSVNFHSQLRGLGIQVSITALYITYLPEANTSLAITISFSVQINVPVALTWFTTNSQRISKIPISTFLTPLTRIASLARAVEATVRTL